MHAIQFRKVRQAAVVFRAEDLFQRAREMPPTCDARIRSVALISFELG
jgi:hypothetical protein